MGAHHTTYFGQHLQAATTGRYYIHVEEPIDRTQIHRVYSLMDRKTAKHLASMSTQPLPGCCGAVVFYHFNGTKLKDIHHLIELGRQAAGRAGFGLTILTLREESKLLTAILTENDNTSHFTNGKTGNNVWLLATGIHQEPPQRRVSNVEGE